MKIEITLAPEAKDFLSNFLESLQATINKEAESVPEDQGEEEPLNVAEAARIFGVTRQTLSRWTKEGKIKGFTVGGRRYYYLSEIRKHLIGK